MSNREDLNTKDEAVVNMEPAGADQHEKEDTLSSISDAPSVEHFNISVSWWLSIVHINIGSHAFNVYQLSYNTLHNIRLNKSKVNMHVAIAIIML